MSQILADWFWKTTPTGAIICGVFVLGVTLYRIVAVAAGHRIADDSDATKGAIFLGLLVGAAFLAFGFSML